MICKKIDISVDSYQETAALYTYFLDNSPEMIRTENVRSF